MFWCTKSLIACNKCTILISFTRPKRLPPSHTLYSSFGYTSFCLATLFSVCLCVIVSFTSLTRHYHYNIYLISPQTTTRYSSHRIKGRKFVSPYSIHYMIMIVRLYHQFTQRFHYNLPYLIINLFAHQNRPSITLTNAIVTPQLSLLHKLKRRSPHV